MDTRPTAPKETPMQNPSNSTTLRWHDSADCGDVKARRDRALAHKTRCRQLQPVSHREVGDMVAQYLAQKGAVTLCPAAYVAPVG
jgi:hypothetical protein